MQLDLRKLPFAFLSNVTDSTFTGTLDIVFLLKELLPDTNAVVTEATDAWVRAVNDQFLTTGNKDALINAQPWGQVDRHQVLIVKMQCANIEPSAWVVLLALLSQIQHAHGILKMLQLQIDTGAPVVDATAGTWPTVAVESLFSLKNRPECFDLIGNLTLDETIDFSMELEVPLDNEKFDLIQGSLQLFGYLVVMGAFHFDFQEHEMSDESLGRISQLTPLWFEYSKDGFDAPPESLLLVDNWTRGLHRKNVNLKLIEISQ